VERNRLEFLPPVAGTGEHLEQYGRIDVALDTAPYNGTTTTCESLFMGVPVMTLAGTVSGARVGVSLLSVVGLTDLIASDEDHFVRLRLFPHRFYGSCEEVHRELPVFRSCALPMPRQVDRDNAVLLRERWHLRSPRR